MMPKIAAYYHAVGDNEEVVPILRESFKKYANAFDKIGSLATDHPASEAEVDKAINDLWSLHNFLKDTIEGETLHQMLQRVHKSAYLKAHKQEIDSEVNYDQEFGFIDFATERVMNGFLNFEKFEMADVEAEEKRLSDERKAKIQAERDLIKQKAQAAFPVSGKKLGLYYLQCAINGDAEKLNALEAFSQKLSEKTQAIWISADARLKDQYEGVDKIMQASSDMYISALSNGYALQRGTKEVTPELMNQFIESGNKIIENMTAFRDLNPKVYQELCADFDREIRETDFSSAEPLLQSAGGEGNVLEKTSEQWIDDLKKQASSKFAQKSTLYPRDHFAKIIAARILTDARRNSPETLKTSVSLDELNKKASELMQNPCFRDFMASLQKNPKKLREAEKAANTGHGGGLEDLFTAYLKKAPAGSLRNDSVLARYLPNAKTRIEFLKKQAEAKMKTGGGYEKEAAEILAIRNLVHAERGRKSSLDKQIPTGRKEGLQTLVGRIADKESFRNLLQHADVRDAVTDGHGGLMVDRMREKAADPKQAQDPKQAMDPFVKDALNANTYGGRMKEIRREAEELNKNVHALKIIENDVRKEQFLNQAKILAGEYMALTYSAGTSIKDSEGKNIPWRDVRKQAGKLTGSAQFSLLFPDVEEAEKQIKNLIEKDPLTFIEGTQKLPAPKIPGKGRETESEKGAMEIGN